MPRLRPLAPIVATLLVAACTHSPPPTRNIHFDSAKSKPRADEDFVELGRVVELMKLDGRLRLLIVGHTDADGSHEYNRKLAFERARRVRQVLVDTEPTIAQRLSLAYHGKLRPIADNRTADGKAANRRVELYFYYPKPGVDDEARLQRDFGGGLEFEASASISASTD